MSNEPPDVVAALIAQHPRRLGHHPAAVSAMACEARCIRSRSTPRMPSLRYRTGVSGVGGLSSMSGTCCVSLGDCCAPATKGSRPRHLPLLSGSAAVNHPSGEDHG